MSAWQGKNNNPILAKADFDTYAKLSGISPQGNKSVSHCTYHMYTRIIKEIEAWLISNYPGARKGRPLHHTSWLSTVTVVYLIPSVNVFVCLPYCLRKMACHAEELHSGLYKTQLGGHKPSSSSGRVKPPRMPDGFPLYLHLVLFSYLVTYFVNNDHGDIQQIWNRWNAGVQQYPLFHKNT